MTVLEGRVTRADRAAHPYRYLEVAVPAGTTRLAVRLEHDPGNVIDLGVVDPRATTFPTAAGFRGWSGGARDRFEIATDAATPGYLPGPLPAGAWHVVLGLYRIAEEGCAYRVTVELDDAPRPEIGPAPAPPRFALAPGEADADGAAWLPGDLQSHSHHSDAKGSLEDLARAARARGLRFLAVTDHNTVSHHRHLPALSGPDLLLVPGEEVTTADGHLNVWGATDWVDFRIREPEDVARVVERAHELGGLASVNHPKPGGPAWRYPVPPGLDAVEAWQAPWPAGNEAALAFCDRLLAEGRRVVLVGGSDRHQPGWPEPDPPALRVGSPTTWLRLAELSVPAVLAALRSGRVGVSASPEAPRLDLTLDGVPMGGEAPRAARHEARVRLHPAAAAGGADGGGDGPAELRLVAMGEVVFAERLGPDAREAVVTLDGLPAEACYLRAELRDAATGHMRALGNPVFLVDAPRGEGGR